MRINKTKENKSTCPFIVPKSSLNSFTHPFLYILFKYTLQLEWLLCCVLHKSNPFGPKVATASPTVRNILSSPIKSDNFDACSFSITIGPGFAKRSCQNVTNMNNILVQVEAVL